MNANVAGFGFDFILSIIIINSNAKYTIQFKIDWILGTCVGFGPTQLPVNLG